MNEPTTLVLLRHGETPLTPYRRLSGSGGDDPSLSRAGRLQAQATAEALNAHGGVQAVVTSPLRRCRQTAQAVAERLSLEVAVDQRLREADFGAWEGMTFAEVRERYAEDFAAWLKSPAAAPSGGGEPFEQVTQRVAAARDALLSRHAGEVILVVSHVGPLRTLVRLALQAPTQSLFRMELAAASLSYVAYDANGGASVRLLNDTSHLRYQGPLSLDRCLPGPPPPTGTAREWRRSDLEAVLTHLEDREQRSLIRPSPLTDASRN